MHNNLRSQTQIRLDEGFLGFESTPTAGNERRRVGVGLIDESLRLNTITNRSEKGDFSMNVARNFAINPGGNPLLFVIKKNVSILRNLVTQWVAFAAAGSAEDGRPVVRDVPVLVIDDEADYGSVDTREGAVESLTATVDNVNTIVREMRETRGSVWKIAARSAGWWRAEGA